MTITVRTTDGASHLHEGTGWHVDDDGHLHVRTASAGNAATFHRDHWCCASKA